MKFYILNKDGSVNTSSDAWIENGIRLPECPDIKTHVLDFDTNKWVFNAELDKQVKTQEILEQRAEDYPDMGQQLDAIMKWVASMNMQNKDEELGMPPELVSIAGQCMAVKAQHPKPE